MMQVYCIRGDGACLFRSLSYVMYNTEDRHQEIRRRIVNYVVANWSRFAYSTLDVSKGTEQPYRSAQQYFDDMIKPNTFGTYTEIVAAADIFPYTFHIYNKGRLILNVGAPNTPVKNLNFSGDFGSGHFDVLLSSTCVHNTNINPNQVIGDTNVSSWPYSLDDSRMAEIAPTIADVSANSQTILEDYLEILFNFFMRYHPEQIEYLDSIREQEDWSRRIEGLHRLWNVIYVTNIMTTPVKFENRQAAPTSISNNDVNVSYATTTTQTQAAATTVTAPYPIAKIKLIFNEYLQENIDLLLHDPTLSDHSKQSLNKTLTDPSVDTVNFLLKDVVASANVRNFITVNADREYVVVLSNLILDYTDILIQRGSSFVQSLPLTVARSIEALIVKRTDMLPYNLILYIDRDEIKIVNDTVTKDLIEAYNLTIPIVLYKIKPDVQRDQGDDRGDVSADHGDMYVDDTYSTDGSVVRDNRVPRRKRKINPRKRVGDANVAFGDDYDTFVAAAGSIDDLIMSVNGNETSDAETVNLHILRETAYKQQIRDSGRRPRHIAGPLPVSMPKYLKTLVATMPTDVEDSYLTCPTNSLLTVPRSENYRSKLTSVATLNLSQLSNSVHFYRMLEPLTYYGNTLNDQSQAIWFIVRSSRYFIMAAEKFYEIRAGVRNYNDPDRLTMFMILYNFLWFYRQFISTLPASALTPNKNLKIVNLLEIFSRTVQTNFNQIHFSDPVSYSGDIGVDRNIIRLMLGEGGTSGATSSTANAASYYNDYDEL